MRPMKPKIVIYVEGGVVQGVRTNMDIDVELFDVDNLHEEHTNEEICFLWEKKTREYPMDDVIIS